MILANLLTQKKASEVIDALLKDDYLSEIEAVSKELESIKDWATIHIGPNDTQYRIGFDELEPRFSRLIRICNMIAKLYHRSKVRRDLDGLHPELAFRSIIEALAYFKATEELIPLRCQKDKSKIISIIRTGTGLNRWSEPQERMWHV